MTQSGKFRGSTGKFLLQNAHTVTKEVRKSGGESKNS
jgi:hypothetical protein